jgi:hypothetical protein
MNLYRTDIEQLDLEALFNNIWKRLDKITLDETTGVGQLAHYIKAMQIEVNSEGDLQHVEAIVSFALSLNPEKISLHEAVRTKEFQKALKAISPVYYKKFSDKYLSA